MAVSRTIVRHLSPVDGESFLITVGTQQASQAYTVTLQVPPSLVTLQEVAIPCSPSCVEPSLL